MARHGVHRAVGRIGMLVMALAMLAMPVHAHPSYFKSLINTAVEDGKIVAVETTRDAEQVLHAAEHRLKTKLHHSGLPAAVFEEEEEEEEEEEAGQSAPSDSSSVSYVRSVESSWLKNLRTTWGYKGKLKKLMGIKSATGCKTTKGIDCVFPYSYHGKDYFDCNGADIVAPETGNFWCPTEIQAESKYWSPDMAWGKCDPQTCLRDLDGKPPPVRVVSTDVGCCDKEKNLKGHNKGNFSTCADGKSIGYQTLSSCQTACLNEGTKCTYFAYGHTNYSYSGGEKKKCTHFGGNLVCQCWLIHTKCTKENRKPEYGYILYEHNMPEVQKRQKMKEGPPVRDKCKTKDGDICAFPFRDGHDADNDLHHKCTHAGTAIDPTTGKEAAWCATKTGPNKELVRWGFCAESCLTEPLLPPENVELVDEAGDVDAAMDERANDQDEATVINAAQIDKAKAVDAGAGGDDSDEAGVETPVAKAAGDAADAGATTDETAKAATKVKAKAKISNIFASFKARKAAKAASLSASAAAAGDAWFNPTDTSEEEERAARQRGLIGTATTDVGGDDDD